MEPERWHRVDNILQAALGLNPAERSLFVDSACAGDEALRDEVISLLSLDEEGLSIIDSPALEAAACVLASDQPDLIEGQFVGHFRILSLLGVGGMGEVYLAEDTKLGRKIALKLLPVDFSRDRDRVRRFQQEARAASALNHPYIVTIHETGEFQDRHFIATEFIEGETLRERMRHTRLNLDEILDISIQVADALGAAHQADIVHRDIKPENIMRRPDGYVKVLDFGLAKPSNERSSEGYKNDVEIAGSTPGLIVGTVKYMSPEQARGLKVDTRSDIFGLGVVIYEMVTGRMPFEGQTNSDLIAAILKVDPPPLTQLSANVPAELERIVRKALCKDRDERYQTIRDMLVEIKGLKESLDLEAKLLRSGHFGANKLSTASGRARVLGGVSLPVYILGRIKKTKTASATITVAVVLVAIAGWWASENYFKAGVPLPFRERDWVLITSFDNRTGEPALDGSIEYALERELSNSTFVNVAPPERIEDALRLMKKPPDTKVDLAIGKEVCLRDGGIRALLAGRTEKLGSTCVLSVSLVDPHSGQAVATGIEEARGEDQVGPAVRRLSNWVRKTLGEKLASIRQSNQELEKVTTPSLRALQLYTQGEALGRIQHNWPVAEQLFRQALAEDPEFASAYTMLAWSLRNQNKPEEEWKPPSDRALQLSERVSERERYFIQGSYYSMRRQEDKAVPVYEALLKRYPDHYWGRNNLAIAYLILHRFQDALVHYMYRADLRPNDFDLQLRAADTAWKCRREDESLRYAKRANDLISPELMKSNPFGVAWVQFRLAGEPFWRGDLETAQTEVDRLAQTVDARSGRERDAFANASAICYLTVGKLKTADEFAQKISPDVALRCFDLALIAITKNDKVSLRKNLLEYLRRASGWDNPAVLPLLIRAGLVLEAHNLISTSAVKEEGFMKVCQGERALAQGKTAQAIPLLQQGVRSLQYTGETSGVLYAGAESLAAAYERQGDFPAALGVLEEASRENETIVPTRVFWLRIKSQLARLYRKLGRVEDAQKIEAELLSTLRYADADHPILRQIRQVEGR